MALHFFVCFKYVHQPRLEFLNVDKFGLDVAFLWGGWFFHCVCLTAFQLVPPSHEDKKMSPDIGKCPQVAGAGEIPGLDNAFI